MEARLWRSAAFVAAAGHGEETEALEAALVQVISAARAQWPESWIEDATFVRHLAERTPPSADACAHLASLHASDLYLACACACGADVPRALAAFDQLCLGDMTLALARTRTPENVADEIKQALRERLFLAAEGKRAKIADYSGAGALRSWVRVAAVRMASNLRRGERSRVAAEQNAPPATMAALDPELDAMRRRFGEAFSGAFRQAFMELSAEQRTMLRLFYVDALNIARIGDLLGVSRATIGRMMIAARGEMMEATLGLLRARLKVSAEELESLLGVVRSKLELSLGALLGEPAVGRAG